MTMTLPRTIDFAEFHETSVPRWLAVGRGRPGARDVGEGRSLTLRVGNKAYSYTSSGNNLMVRPGTAESGVVAEMAPDAFSDFANEMWSVFGLMYSQRVAVARGSFDQFAAWEPALQALWFDRPIYRADTVSSLDGLDLSRSFTLESDRAEMADFLSRTGYLVVRGVFSAAEVAAFNAIVVREKATATPADKRSWWAQDAQGNEVCCRLTYMAERDPAIRALDGDARLTALAGLAGAELLPSSDRLDGTSVVIKNPAIVSGLSDLPWHRDCGMGGHFVLCPGLNIGIQLTRADAANGQLWYLAGSHRHATQSLTMDDLAGLPAVAIDAEPGDVTVHYGHVLHAAPAPTSATADRQTLYTGWHVPALFDLVPPGQGYNDVLFTHGDGRVRSVEEAS